MKNHRLVVFGTDYDRYPSGIQHICDQYLPDNEIIWVETIGMRPPSLSVYDIKRSLEKIWGWLKGKKRDAQRKLPSGLSIINPVLVPYSQFKIIRKFNLRQMKRAIAAETQRRSWTHDYTAIYTSPSDRDFTGQIGERNALYYCIDEFSLWPGMNRGLIQDLDRELTQSVDMVVVSSDALLTSKKQLSANVHLLTHGVDAEHFGKADASLYEDSTLKEDETFHMAYFGLFDERTDQDLLLRLMEELPDAKLSIIGDVMTDVSRLKEHGRIHFCGKIAYRRLPESVRDVDLFLLPYVLNELSININPLKIKEYMATGKPCLATPLPEVVKFADSIFVAQNADDFVQTAQRVKMGMLTHDSARAKAIAAEESWQQKSAQFSRYLMQLTQLKGLRA